jgi:hypothetical protein
MGYSSLSSLLQDKPILSISHMECFRSPAGSLSLPLQYSHCCVVPSGTDLEDVWAFFVLWLFFFFFLLAVLGIKSRPFHMLGEHSTTELHISPCPLSVVWPVVMSRRESGYSCPHSFPVFYDHVLSWVTLLWLHRILMPLPFLVLLSACWDDFLLMPPGLLSLSLELDSRW